MHDTIRQWIADILTANPTVGMLALSQRAKFEGWLKIELAAHAVAQGVENVVLEAPLNNGTKEKCDISFNQHGHNYLLELKTPNTNWRIPGAMNRIRPITKNIESIIRDVGKLSTSPNGGIIAFVLFPVPRGSQCWHTYVNRIGESVHIDLPRAHCTTVTFPLGDVVVCSFPVSGVANLQIQEEN